MNRPCFLLMLACLLLSAHADVSDRFDVRTVKAGSTAHVDVYVDVRLDARAMVMARQLLRGVEIHYTRVADAFRATYRPRVNLIITPRSPGLDGSGGGYHYDGLWEIYADVQHGPGTTALKWDFTSAIFTIELTELFAGDGGWSSDWTTGEALSRFVGACVVPRTLDTYETTPLWMNAGRPNYVATSLPTRSLASGDPYDFRAVGCEVCFLYYLRSHLGIPLATIIAAEPIGNPPSLEGTFRRLTGRRNGYAEMRRAVDALHPPGVPVAWGIQNDNLFD